MRASPGEEGLCGANTGTHRPSVCSAANKPTSCPEHLQPRTCASLAPGTSNQLSSTAGTWLSLTAPQTHVTAQHLRNLLSSPAVCSFPRAFA